MIRKIKEATPIVLFVALIVGGLIAPFFTDWNHVGVPMDTLYIPLLYNAHWVLIHGIKHKLGEPVSPDPSMKVCRRSLLLRNGQ